MILTLDIENTVSKLPSGKVMLDPFTEGNELVLVCTRDENSNENSYFFNHKTHTTEQAHEKLQAQLDDTTMLVCHNAQHELVWLWSCGFTYTGPVFDTLLVEYLFLRGQKDALSLGAVADRYNLENKKMDTLQQSFAAGLSVNEINGDQLEEYCLADVKATQELAHTLRKKLHTEEYSSLQNIVQLTNEMCVLLAKIYSRGFKINITTLQRVKTNFKTEQAKLISELSNIIAEVMGDTPINLASPEQLSAVIYSRAPRNKAEWPGLFHKYMKREDFLDVVQKNSTLFYKTRAEKCMKCNGKGHTYPLKKDGTPSKAKRKCKNCAAKGVVFVPQKEVAGFKFIPPAASWVSAGGFTTSKVHLNMLETAARRINMPAAVNFLSKIRRLSALDTYLQSFVAGIETYLKHNDMLHVRLVQLRTATGRLSSDSPNMQNIPRSTTFPVKAAFQSRWEDGSIIEADFAQLEFRTAAQLSQDQIALDEIAEGFDVHAYTAKVITEAGQPTTRQEAKAHTFAPLFGATGFGRTKAEAAYYEQFVKKYKGIAKWHTTLANEVMTEGKITTPTGRQFLFPDCVRTSGGGITHFTSVKNYPVQSLATDIVQLSLLILEETMQEQELQSMIVNSVHDSIVVDTFAGEEQQVYDCIKKVETLLPNRLLQKLHVDIQVALPLEYKQGNSWMI